MATAFDKLFYDTAQAARVSWYFGQKLLAARLTKPIKLPAPLKGRAMPSRQALVPLGEALLETAGGVRSARLFDIACGTGGFLTEIKRNYPRLAVTGIDLSAPYLAVAERRLSAWSRVALAEANAERLPFAD